MANAMVSNAMVSNAMGANAMGANAMESAYIAQLNPMEQKILQIARSHLETSFSLNKSIGFQEWQKAQEPQAQPQVQPAQQDPQVQPAQPEPQAQQVQPEQQAKKPLIKRKIKIKSKPS
jgi:hypothetical protein